MNKEKMLELADFIENELRSEEFDMDDWIDERSCRTVACVAGWACLHFLGSRNGDHYVVGGVRYSSIAKAAAAALEFGAEEWHNDLFYLCRWPQEWQLRWQESSKERKRSVAATYIRWYVQQFKKEEE